MKSIVLFLAMMITSTFAFGDTVVYQLGNPSTPALAAYPGPYVQLTVDVTSAGTATLTFDSLSNGTYTYLMGGGAAAAFNLSSPTAGITSITYTPYFGTPPTPTVTSVNNLTFGLMNQSVNFFGGNYTTSLSQIKVNVTGGSWGVNDAGSVLQANANGYLAFSRVFACNNNGAACTVNDLLEGGSAGVDNLAVPEPATMIMLGSLCSAVAGYKWKRRERV